MNAKLEEIKKKMTDDGLRISRVPKEVKHEFMNLANSEEFLGDYGFCLKWLMDFRKGILSSPNQQLVESIEELNSKLSVIEKRLHRLEQEPEQEEEVIRTVGGRIIRREKR